MRNLRKNKPRNRINYWIALEKNGRGLWRPALALCGGFMTITVERRDENSLRVARHYTVVGQLGNQDRNLVDNPLYDAEAEKKGRPEILKLIRR